MAATAMWDIVAIQEVHGEPSRTQLAGGISYMAGKVHGAKQNALCLNLWQLPFVSDFAFMSRSSSAEFVLNDVTWKATSVHFPPLNPTKVGAERECTNMVESLGSPRGSAKRWLLMGDFNAELGERFAGDPPGIGDYAGGLGSARTQIVDVSWQPPLKI